MKLRSMKDLYIHELQDLCDAQERLQPVLSQMLDKAGSPELKDILLAYHQETTPQIERLEGLMKSLGIPAEGRRCEGMCGLIKESRDILEATGDQATVDAALIACCNRIQHYMIAAYGCATTYAKVLDLAKHARDLQKSLNEHGAEDKSFTAVAEQLNVQSVGA